jgi:hypothetical protein
MKITIDTQGYLLPERLVPERRIGGDKPEELLTVPERPSEDDFEIAYQTCQLLEARYSGNLPGLELEAISVAFILREPGKYVGKECTFLPRFTTVLRNKIDGEKIKSVWLVRDLFSPKEKDYVAKNIPLCAGYVAEHIHSTLFFEADKLLETAKNLKDSMTVFGTI